MIFPTVIPLLLIAAHTLPTPRHEQKDVARKYPVAVSTSGQKYIADEILLGTKASASITDITAMIQRAGADVVGFIPGISVMRVVLPNTLTIANARAVFLEFPGVLYVEAHDIGEGGWLSTPNDTHFGLQWHHRNIGQYGGSPGADIETTEAWPLLPTPQPVVLAVLDTGIDFLHPEFQSRVVPGWDYVNEDPDASADHNHGIYCAGLAAAATDNGFGTAGVDKHCTIYPIKVLNASNSGTVFDLVQALQDCAINKIDVVSMSLINYGSSVTLENGLIAARNAGCILIACAGNGGLGDANVSGPGQSVQTISIGATTVLDRRASFSGTGSKLDFVAPGANVVTTSPAQSNTYALFSGCSASTPIAAGIVCMLKGKDPSLTQQAVYELLRIGSEDQVGLPSEDTVGKDNYMGWGRLNARRSVALMTPSPSPVQYGTSKATSSGSIPTMGWFGAPRHSFNNFSVTLESALPGVLALVFHGPSSQSVPWQGGTLLVSPPLVRMSAINLDNLGSGVWPFEIQASQIGTQRCFQAWFRDPAQADGTNVGISNGLSVTLGL